METTHDGWKVSREMTIILSYEMVYELCVLLFGVMGALISEVLTETDSLFNCFINEGQKPLAVLIRLGSGDPVNL